MPDLEQPVSGQMKHNSATSSGLHVAPTTGNDAHKPATGSEDPALYMQALEFADRAEWADVSRRFEAIAAVVVGAPVRMRLLLVLSKPYPVGALGMPVASDRVRPTAAIMTRALVATLFGPTRTARAAGAAVIRMHDRDWWLCILPHGVVVVNRVPVDPPKSVANMRSFDEIITIRWVEAVQAVANRADLVVFIGSEHEARFRSLSLAANTVRVPQPTWIGQRWNWPIEAIQHWHSALGDAGFDV